MSLKTLRTTQRVYFREQFFFPQSSSHSERKNNEGKKEAVNQQHSQLDRLYQISGCSSFERCCFYRGYLLETVSVRVAGCQVAACTGAGLVSGRCHIAASLVSGRCHIATLCKRALDTTDMKCSGHSAKDSHCQNRHQ